MRPTLAGRTTLRRRLIAAAPMLATTVMAAVLFAGSAAAAVAPAQPGVVPGHLIVGHLAFDQPVIVTGQLPSSDSGHTLALDFLAAGARTWRPLATTVVPASATYRLSAALRRSGFVRVVDVTIDPGSATSPALGLASPSSSKASHVSVAAELIVAAHDLTARGGGAVAVQGRLRPAWAGRAVSLQGSSGGVWHTLAATRTGASGGFTLRFVPGPGSERLRVRFTGDASNTGVVAAAGTASGAYQAAVASWYYDAGATACGFHAYYGVANKSLPCGTRVTFVYGGRSVTATVDDRGPYVSGRTWDLNQNTAAALDFQAVGVATVWAAYLDLPRFPGHFSA